MILKSPNLFLQNVCKNRLLTEIILENNKNYDILFIQELLWFIICQILSSLSEEEENIVGTSHHLSWITFARSSTNGNDYLRVITYINAELIGLQFSLRKNIFNH